KILRRRERHRHDDQRRQHEEGHHGGGRDVEPDPRTVRDLGVRGRLVEPAHACPPNKRSSRTSRPATNRMTAVSTSSTTPSALAAPQLKKISMSLAMRLATMISLP